MEETDLNRVLFFSKEDLAGIYYLQKIDSILNNKIEATSLVINDIFELYHIKQYIDHDIFMKKWTQKDILNFKQKVKSYGEIIGSFLSAIDNTNFVDYYNSTIPRYKLTFWTLFSKQNIFKQVSKINFSTFLIDKPQIIHEILEHKNLVEYYRNEIKDFLISYSKSAEILLSIYGTEDSRLKRRKFVPTTLTILEKENIISNYLDMQDRANINYVEIIENIRTQKDFKISNKIRLKAKRLCSKLEKKMFSIHKGIKFKILINFKENTQKIKEAFIDDDRTLYYLYSLDYINKYNDFYTLYQNFKYLFEFVDLENRIDLISKANQLTIFERYSGVCVKNQYPIGIVFTLSELTSQQQVYCYSKVLNNSHISLEEVLSFVFTSSFQEKYNFPENAYFSVPPSTNTHLEKIRLLAPEFESILKQFKLFVEEGSIDFDLLQISSAPVSIKDIPSLNPKKYLYLDKDNEKVKRYLFLLFSDQALLSYIKPFEGNNYNNFFDLIINEQVNFNLYEEYQKLDLIYLLENNLISITRNGIIETANLERLLILKDINDNEVGSYYHYENIYKNEADQMVIEKIITFDSTLLSKPEQNYFNYILNKSEYTNGLNIRNDYTHGSQPTHNEIEKHEFAYYNYLKLFFLILLKIEDDLAIFTKNKIEIP